MAANKLLAAIIWLIFLSIIHVPRLLNGSWKVCNFNFESGLHVFKDFLVFICWNEWDGKTFGAKSSGSTHSVKILVRLVWHIVIDHHIDLLDIYASSE